MSSWTEARYEEKAAEIARQHGVTRKPLNDVLEKVAREDALTSDEIRTLGRMANVKAFKVYFDEREKQGADRMVEFEVADPEVVIQRITTAAEKVVAPATVENDKLAFEIPDQMREIRHPTPPQEKVAAAPEEHALRPADQEKVAMALVKIADDLEIERIQLGHRWEREVTELTDRFKIANAHTPDYGRFMLDALATRGRDAYPEVVTVAQGLRLPIPVVSNEKIAELAVRRVVSDSPELKLLERAVETRFAYDECKRMLKVISDE